MREILFRAWHKELKMHYKVASISFYNKNAFVEVKKGEYVLVDFERLVFEQYTGFKDKNGVKIFEGDVVDTHDADNNSTKALVEFEEGYLGIGGAYYDFEPICEFNYSQWEVLGSKEKYGHLVDNIDWVEVR